MVTKGKAKTFDTVAMVREIRDKLAEEMKGLSPEEKVAFIRERTRLAQRSGSKGKDNSTSE